MMINDRILQPAIAELTLKTNTANILAVHEHSTIIQIISYKETNKQSSTLLLFLTPKAGNKWDEYVNM